MAAKTSSESPFISNLYDSIVQYNNSDDNNNITMSPNITYEDSNHLYERQVETALWIYVSPILIILGTIGNGLTILLLQRRKMRTSSWSQYLTALAVADLTVLYTGLLGEWIIHLTQSNVDVRTLSDPGCKIHLFMTYASIHLSAWILVAVTLDRVIFVYFPIRAKYLCTVRMAKYCLLGMVLAISALNMHFFWTFHMKDYVSARICFVKGDYQEFWLDTWSILDSFIASYFPFLIMLISNILIIVRLLYARHQRIAMTGATQNSTSMTQVTVMLLTVNFVFLICTGPIVFLLDVFFNKNEKKENAETEAQLSLTRAALTLLHYANNSTNFICYCISGPRFRKELANVLCGRKERNNPSYISQGNSHHMANETNGENKFLSRKLTMTEFLRNSSRIRRSNGNTAYAKVENISCV